MSPLRLRDLGTMGDWARDCATMAGLVLIIAIVCVFAGALIDTPDGNHQRPHIGDQRR